MQFFFNDRAQSFPLYEEAIKLMDHPDGMVRTAVRAITLNVYRVNDASMRKFLFESPVAVYFEHVSNFMSLRCRRVHLLLLRVVYGPNSA